MGYDAEYLVWDADVRKWFDERLAILSDGGRITTEMDRLARFEAHAMHVRLVSERASNHAGVSFSWGGR